MDWYIGTSGFVVWVVSCFHIEKAFSQTSLVGFVWFGGSSIWTVAEVALTLDKYPTNAISVAKQSPRPPFAIGKAKHWTIGKDLDQMTI